jgi:HSP20 family protein
MESDEDVRVIMELPGVEKKDIKVQANERSLDLEVVGQEKRFRKHLELPCDVLPDSAKANYKNGVLEIVLKRHAPKRKGCEVRVE